MMDCKNPNNQTNSFLPRTTKAHATYPYEISQFSQKEDEQGK
jgi:hypothetical protein